MNLTPVNQWLDHVTDNGENRLPSQEFLRDEQLTHRLAAELETLDVLFAQLDQAPVDEAWPTFVQFLIKASEEPRDYSSHDNLAVTEDAASFLRFAVAVNEQKALMQEPPEQMLFQLLSDFEGKHSKNLIVSTLIAQRFNRMDFASNLQNMLCAHIKNGPENWASVREVSLDFPNMIKLLYASLNHLKLKDPEFNLDVTQKDALYSRLLKATNLIEYDNDANHLKATLRIVQHKLLFLKLYQDDIPKADRQEALTTALLDSYILRGFHDLVDDYDIYDVSLFALEAVQSQLHNFILEQQAGLNIGDWLESLNNKVISAYCKKHDYVISAYCKKHIDYLYDSKREAYAEIGTSELVETMMKRLESFKETFQQVCAQQEAHQPVSLDAKVQPRKSRASLKL